MKSYWRCEPIYNDILNTSVALAMEAGYLASIQVRSTLTLRLGILWSTVTSYYREPEVTYHLFPIITNSLLMLACLRVAMVVGEFLVVL